MTQNCLWCPNPKGQPPPSFVVFILFVLFTQTWASLSSLRFTSHRYNASVPENALGNTFVISDEKMGIFLSREHAFNIRYRITDGDPNGFFKVNARVIGDFCFLEISVKTGNSNVLNRESKDFYYLSIKAQHRRDDKSKEDLQGVVTVVYIAITDLNDLSPLFLENRYQVRVSEDTPLYTSIAKVKAEDPDDDLNGQVYYSFQNPTSVFAIHPTTGVVSLTRQLSQPEQPRYELQVLAKDRGLQMTGSWPSTVSLVINVTVVNVFEPSMEVIKLTETISSGHLMIMAIINVRDNDRGASGEIKILEIVEGDPDRVFRIIKGSTPNEFNIAALRTLNWDNAPYGFNLSLKATDNGARPRFSYNQVRISPPRMPVEEPVFSHEEYDVVVNEISPPGTKIAKISTWLPGTQNKVSFSIIAGNEDNQFKIDRKSGVLYTNTYLDADSKDSHSLTVSATSSGRYGSHHQNSAKVIVKITDANDYTPIIVAPQGAVTVEEHQNQGSWVTQVRAQDYDSGENKRVSYSLVNDEDVPFIIDNFSGEIRTSKNLDYETGKRLWKLRVRAADWGTPFRRQSEKTIIVRVVDINDNRPQFEQIDCTGYIDRAAPLSTEIYTLSALDFDEGNIISYRILAGNEDRCFTLDATSGVLTLTCDLQDLRSSERFLNVTATDGQHFADTVTIRLQLLQQKASSGSWAALDCKPMEIARKLAEQISLASKNNPNEEDINFRLLTPPPPPNLHSPEVYVSRVDVRVRENSNLGTLVHHIQAYDPDEGYDGYLTYAITDGNEESVFDIEMTSGNIVVAGLLDRERVARYSLNVSIFDFGEYRRSTFQLVTVTVIDENDNAPKFDKVAYSFFLPENVENGTSVYQLLAYDLDEGVNGVTTYRLETDTKDFYLDSVSGVLSVSSPLDYEKQDVYELSVVATDGGGSSSYAYVTVELVDINDCPPEFAEGKMLRVRIPEDLPVGALVTLVTARDPDSSNLFYYLEEGHDDMFDLDEHTAALRLGKRLDYEFKSLYNITIRATDDEVPQLSAVVFVIIQVVDVNENIHSPVFGQDVLEAKVSESAPPHTLVASAPAKDGDLNLNPSDASITYSLVGTEGVGLFYIDHKGDIYTCCWLDRETKSRYWLTVRATDSGTVPRHATLHVYIEVEDVNDNRPLSSWPIYWPEVSENSPPKSLVCTIAAEDPDLGPTNHGITFSIAAGNPQSLFDIDAKSGEIWTTVRRLDREQTAEHFLEILISDNSDSSISLSSTAYVVVNINDENDNAPEFLEPIYKITVPLYGSHLQKTTENSTRDVHIGQAMTTILKHEDLIPLIRHHQYEANDAIEKIQNNSSNNSKKEENVDITEEGSGIISEDISVLLNNENLFITEKRSERSFRITNIDLNEEQSSYHLIPLARMIARDLDKGENGDVSYRLESGEWFDTFKIHPKSGILYAKKDLEPNLDYKITAHAFDNGRPQKQNSCLVEIKTLPVPINSLYPPIFSQGSEFSTSVLESDSVGHLVYFFQADDEDGDKLWFDITDGNEDEAFAIIRENGNILIAKSLNAEKKSSYNLSVEVTDGVHVTLAKISITVLGVNDNRPTFSHPTYEVEVGENTSPGTTIFTLLAVDKDSEKQLTFFLENTAHVASQNKFKIDPISGDIILNESLDREVQELHVLTVGVKDHNIPNKRNFARVTISVQDYNDHSPQFLLSVYNGSVLETMEVGSRILQVVAFDKDKGKNGHITYSIKSGNIGGTFTLDPESGLLSLARSVDLQVRPEYWLTVKGSDNGSPPRDSYVNINIQVKMGPDASPRFSKKEYLFDVSEKTGIGTFIGPLAMESDLGVVYSLIPGNSESPFVINPSTGVLSLDKPLDYEEMHSYNLTVIATSMNGKESTSQIIVSIKDENDNAPHFLQTFYVGHISEASSVNSVVLMNNSRPLVVFAKDEDSEQNANLVYTILEEEARVYFSIDSSTGAIRTTAPLDHEVLPHINFSVSVRDSGKPILTSPTSAQVSVSITDINDVPPRFLIQEYNATLLVPSYKGVSVVRLNATDLDFEGKSDLHYAIAAGNEDGTFNIDSKSGLICVNNSGNFKNFYILKATVSDGQFASSTTVNIYVEKIPKVGLRFAREKYFASVEENSTKIEDIAMVQVLGSELNEHLTFRILNPIDLFTIRDTSGVIQTTGIPFDREEQENYLLVVEVYSSRSSLPRRIAHVLVHVVVLDINDNAPIFVNTPYYGVVSIDSSVKSVIYSVHATDFDSEKNSKVRYELQRGNGELIFVERLTGEIRLKKPLVGIAREHELIITAYDGGSPPLSSQVVVRLKIVDRSQPIFDQQFYSCSVSESAEIHTPIITITATSQLNRKLIYTIVDNNKDEKFAIDHDLGVISVQDFLDFEERSSYQLDVRAIDKFSGKYADVAVAVQIDDANDNAPVFAQSFYNISVSESASVASQVLQVTSSDADSESNSGAFYNLSGISGTLPENFYMEGSSGMLILKKALDRETQPYHHFRVIATDLGSPPLSSTAEIYVNVLDMNDNAPSFSQPSFRCSISEGASRGQFVSLVTAFDNDTSDENKLLYSIVSGNALQAFALDPPTGILSAWNHQRLRERTDHLLNISITDGVYTAYTRLAISVAPVNDHSPIFHSASYEYHVMENLPPDVYLTTIVATDEDFGRYGDITYHFIGSEAEKYFRISENTGEVYAMGPFDREKREEYEYSIMAMDIGGRTAFTRLFILIDDDNDNPPEFLRSSFKTLLRSNSTKGSTVLTVSAIDKDTDSNGQVKYRFHKSTPSKIRTSFLIDENSGEIKLLTNADELGDSLFEFFVDAFDDGEKSLHSNAVVLIRVIDGDVEVPEFLSKIYTFAVSEDTKPGTVLGTLAARFDGPLEYRVTWSEVDSPPISVDGNGILTLRTLLDYEHKFKFSVEIFANPFNQQDISTSTIVEIEVQDVNDESPQFEAEKYYISIAENMPIGSNIIKVSAHDKDSGRNSELRYVLEEELPLQEEPVFILDPYSGWLSLNKQLDAEKKAKFSLKVTATDGGTPSMSSTATIVIQVIDYNDNAPKFLRETYHSSVREDAVPGTVVITLDVEDLDETSNDELRYYLSSGNERLSFDIKRGGQIYVARPLDREQKASYEIVVTVTDGAFVASSVVQIDILDVNDNAPICSQPIYKHHISEDALPGTLILRVSAYDPDLLFPPQYYLSGMGSENFAVDTSTGQLSVLKSLDRETQSKYELKVTVRDGSHQDWQCSCYVTIDILDVNDNAPVFSKESYSVNVPENSPATLILMRIYATDPDLGLNRKISYSLDGSYKFSIDRNTGIISSTQSLDREKMAMYNLTVRAFDNGSNRLSSSTNVLVLVKDVNDNPPEFASHTYYTTVMESANVGSDIVRVLATSRDSGKNAEISYSIIGGNEHRKFEIHQRTGVVSVIEPLDYERGSNYLLTIQAKDGGDPPLSNHATVNVTVTDVNDNHPIFIQNSYSAEVNEAAAIGQRLIQVVATDQDSGDNGKITYAISGGDPRMQFHVDKFSGWISVARPLDRETSSSYTLEIIALDRGIPRRSGSVSIYIEVMDSNDNPPVFIVTNNTAYVQEDKPLNHLVFNYEVTDNDSDKDKNGAPFTFEIRSGNTDAAFRITPDGELRTAAKFNHNVKDLYKLQIRVYDNGRPPLYSETWINIKIIEESQFPPVVFPLQVLAYIQSESYFGGVLGKIQASDEDPYDSLAYSLVSNIKNFDFKYFTIDKNTGTVSAKGGVDEGTYALNVSVSDGKFISYGSVEINLIEIKDEMIEGAAIVRLKGASPEEFLLSYRKSFHKGIKNIMKVKPRDVVTISIQDPKNRGRREKSSLLYPSYREGLLDILFAVKKSGADYFSRSYIRRRLNAERKTLESFLGLTVVDIPEDKCKKFSCTNGQCRESITLEKSQVNVATDVMSFVSPLHDHDSVCICPAGFSGRFCETIINQCAHKPCPPYQLCTPQHSKIGYMCVCPDDLVGATCSMNKSDCSGKETSPQCYSPVSPLSFSGKSFVQYVLQLPIERHLTFSVWIRTLNPSGNLMFTSGRLDYSILELDEGQVRFRWDLGSGEGLVSVSSKRVDDGLWHQVAVERIENTVYLTVDEKWRSEGSSPGSSEILNLESHHLYLGAEVRPWTGAEKNPRHGFVGCIDAPRLENSLLPVTHSPSNSVAALMRLSFVTTHCYDQLKAPGLCGTHPCLNGGTCDERENDFVCECDSRFKGPFCELDSNPCASSPCLNNGHCVNEHNNYRCECPAQVTGPRCQYMYCNPNPCLNKGVCEEGISGPICKCRGFTGAYCNVDVNECEKNPCEEGGTCLNTYGGFKCMCPSNFTGSYCDIPSTISAFPIGFTEVIYIVIGISGVVVAALFVIVIMHCREKQISRRRQRIAQNHVILNSKSLDTHHNIYKRNSKVSNIEASQSCTSRPESFPLSPIKEPVYAPLNNFDTIRSYGSAGDELENLPQYSRDFVQNITKANTLHNQNRNPSLSNSSTGISRTSSGFMPQVAYRSPDSESMHKPWKEALGLSLKDAYYEAGKIQNDVKLNRKEYFNLKKRNEVSENVQHHNHPVHHHRDDSSVLSEASVEDMQEYHWDCSDWARPSQNPLPNIQEVPGGEIRDSSSYHSNESNESIVVKSGVNQTFMPPVNSPVDPLRDMETLPADEFISECDTDFELESKTDFDASEIFDQCSDIGAESDASLFISQPQKYETHPNQYLPRYQINSETETDDEKGKLLNNFVRPSYRQQTNILPVGSSRFSSTNTRFPSSSNAIPEPPLSQASSNVMYSPPTGIRLRNNRRLSNIVKRKSFPFHDDDDVEEISLFGAASNTSTSDIDNVCDIDDSEVNSEFENDK